MDHDSNKNLPANNLPHRIPNRFSKIVSCFRAELSYTFPRRNSRLRGGSNFSPTTECALSFRQKIFHVVFLQSEWHANRDGYNSKRTDRKHCFSLIVETDEKTCLFVEKNVQRCNIILHVVLSLCAKDGRIRLKLAIS